MDILVGGVSANFQRYYGQGPTGNPVDGEVTAPKAAFSLMTKDRSIDVICPTLESMNEWVRGLKYLISRLTPSAKDEVESVQEPEGLEMKGEGFSVVEGVRRWSKGRSAFNEEEVMSLKRSAISRLILGSSLLKFLHLGKPHERFFTLHHSLRHLLWEGGRNNKSKRVNLLEIKEVQTMDEVGKEGRGEGVNIKGFHVKNKLAASVIMETVPGLKKDSTQLGAANFGLTLVDFDGERVLNLIAPNEGAYMVWLQGLRWALEEIAVLYPKEYPPAGESPVKQDRRSMKKRVTKTMDSALKAAVKAGRRGSRNVNSILRGTPGSTPVQTPAATPQASPTHSPSISRQSSAGSSQGGLMGERNYDVFSDIGSLAGSVGGESDAEGGFGGYGGVRRMDSTRSSLSDEDEVASQQDDVVSFKDVELRIDGEEGEQGEEVMVGVEVEEEDEEEDDEDDEGYEGGTSERGLSLDKRKKAKSPKGKKKKTRNSKGGKKSRNWKVVWNF